MPEDGRPDDVAAGRFRVLGRADPAPVLEQGELQPRRSAAEAVDHYLHFLGRTFVDPGEELERPLAAVDVVFDAEDREAFFFGQLPGFGQQKGVEVGADAVPRFRPLQVERQFFPCFDGDAEGVVLRRAGIEVHAVGGPQALWSGVAFRFFGFFDFFGEFDDRGRAAAGIAELRRLPGGDVATSGVEQVVVPRGGEVGGAAGDHFVHRACDGAVLEERLFEVGDVVGDHPGAGRRQRPDVGGEGEFPGERGGEGERGAGGEVVDDLGHRPALVLPFGFGIVEHADGRVRAAGAAGPRKVAAGDVAGGIGGGKRIAVEGVGEDADLNAAAVDAETGAGVAGVELAVALRTDRAAAVRAAHQRSQDRGDRGDLGQSADPAQLSRAYRDRRGPVAAPELDDRRAGGAQRARGRGSGTLEAGFDEDAVAVAQQAAGTAGGEAEPGRLLRPRRGADGRARQLEQTRREVGAGGGAHLRGSCRRHGGGQPEHDEHDRGKGATGQTGTSVHLRGYRHLGVILKHA